MGKMEKMGLNDDDGGGDDVSKQNLVVNDFVFYQCSVVN
jgi:hypothetical protein